MDTQLLLLCGFLLLIIYFLLFRFPILSLYIFFLIIIVIGQGFKTNIPSLGGDLPIPYLLAILLAPPVVCNNIVQKQFSIKLKPVVIALIAIFFLTIIGFINGNSIDFIRRECSIFFFIPIMYIWVTLVIRNSKQLETLIEGICILTGIATLKVIFILMTGNVALELNELQAYSTINPQFGVQRVILVGADTFFAIMIPMLFVLILTKRDKYMYYIYYYILFIFCGIGLTLSYTRSNWFAAIISSLLVYSYIKNKVKLNKKNFVLLLFVLFIFSIISQNVMLGLSDYSVSEAIQRRMSFDPEEGSGVIEIRLIEVKEVINAVGNSFFIGKGMGAGYMSSMVSQETYWSHSALATIYLKAGLLGLLLIVYGLFILFRRIKFLLLLNNEDHKVQLIIIGMSGSFVTLFLMSILNNRLYSFEGTAFIGLYIATIQYFDRKFVTINNT